MRLFQFKSAADGAFVSRRSAQAESDTSSVDIKQGNDFKGDIAVDSDEDSLQKYYVPIDTYEGKHRFDPKARWTEIEEKKLIRKVRCVFVTNQVIADIISWI